MATLKIYKCEIKPERNCIVDSIATYLSGLTPTVDYANFQYVKIAQNIKIKVQVDQKYSNQELGNYVRIGEDDRYFFYFITNANWISESAVELTLSLDTLNTFKDNFIFSDKTTLIRQHKNRWKDNSTVLAPSTTYTKNFIIDKTDEGISGIATEMTKSVIQDTTNSSKLQMNWYLVYKTDSSIDSSANQPIKCELYPKTSTTLTVNIANDTILSSDFSTGLMYYVVFNSYNNENRYVQYRTHDYNNDIWSGWSSSIGSTNLYGIAFKKESDGRFSYNILTKTTSNNNTYLAAPNSVWSSGVDKIQFSGGLVKIRYRTISSDYVLLLDGINNAALYSILGNGTANVANISSVNRTDSTLIKIIECPYCPINLIANSSGTITTLPTGWTWKGNIITCNDLSVELIKGITTAQAINGLRGSFTTGADVARMAKSISLEPKLYNSNISTCKLLYDSFSSEIKREQLTPTSNSVVSAAINYKQSNTINSNLCFYWTPNNATYSPIGDYDQYLLAKRNNETTIYSSNYLNYLRTGYNYDKKQMVSSNIVQGLSIAGQVVGGITSAASGNFIGIPFTLANIASSIKNLTESGSNLQRKLDELKVQAVSVSGSDDINLLNYYGDNNKLTIRYYEPPTEVKNKIYDLFYYCGYAATGQDTPSTNTRYWFNFIQCDPVFDTEDTDIYNDYIDDIKTKFKAGVTYYHKHDGDYDWDQQYENWETGLVG